MDSQTIVFVTSTLTSGGSERVMSILANELSKRGHNISIICLNKHIVFYPIDKGIKVIFVEEEIGGKSLFRKILWLRKYVIEVSPDVVIPFMEAVYCFTLLSLIGISVPVISSERIDPRKSPFIRNILRRIFLPLTTHLVVQTEAIKSFYPSFIRKKTSVIYNPVVEEVFRETDNEILIIENEKKLNRIISVGKLDEQKNQQLLIRAFSKISPLFPDLQLVIYGEGPLRENLESLVRCLELEEKVLLPGRTEHVIAEMRKSKLFCFSSDYEGMSNALLEAICVGLPIITTNVSGASELVQDGVNGFIVNIRDEEQMVNAMKRLLSDENMMNQFSEVNIRKASQFSIDIIVGQWESLICEVVKNN